MPEKYVPIKMGLLIDIIETFGFVQGYLGEESPVATHVRTEIEVRINELKRATNSYLLDDDDFRVAREFRSGVLVPKSQLAQRDQRLAELERQLEQSRQSTDDAPKPETPEPPPSEREWLEVEPQRQPSSVLQQLVSGLLPGPPAPPSGRQPWPTEDGQH